MWSVGWPVWVWLIRPLSAARPSDPPTRRDARVGSVEHGLLGAVVAGVAPEATGRRKEVSIPDR